MPISNKSNKGNSAVIIVVVILILLAVSGGGYYYYTKSKERDKNIELINKYLDKERELVQKEAEVGKALLTRNLTLISSTSKTATKAWEELEKQEVPDYFKKTEKDCFDLRKKYADSIKYIDSMIEKENSGARVSQTELSRVTQETRFLLDDTEYENRIKICKEAREKSKTEANKYGIEISEKKEN